MRKNKGKILSIFLIVLSLISIQINAYAHSGRTDSRGGHKDNKNKSGLGSYHYHCGGHPAHLHTNGVCPYSSSSSSSKSSTSNSSSSKSSSSTSISSSSKTTTTTTVPATIDVTAIQINESINSIEVGESKKLTATIKPDNATDKNIKWKSSDESIATISSSGEVSAKKSGTINITASTSNGKTSTIKVDIKEQTKIENSVITNNLVMNKNTTNNTINNTTTNKQDDSNPLGEILILGILGGGGYWGYKKHKKSK